MRTTLFCVWLYPCLFIFNIYLFQRIVYKSRRSIFYNYVCKSHTRGLPVTHMLNAELFAFKYQRPPAKLLCFVQDRFGHVFDVKLRLHLRHRNFFWDILGSLITYTYSTVNFVLSFRMCI